MFTPVPSTETIKHSSNDLLVAKSKVIPQLSLTLPLSFWYSWCAVLLETLSLLNSRVTILAWFLSDYSGQAFHSLFFWLLFISFISNTEGVHSSWFDLFFFLNISVIWFHDFTTVYMLIILKFIEIAQNYPLNSPWLSSTASVGHLVDLSNLPCPKDGSWYFPYTPSLFPEICITCILTLVFVPYDFSHKLPHV